MTGRLAGKRCLITGTGGSIGRASALWFAREGAHIVGTDVNPEQAAITETLVRGAGGEMTSLHPLDLTSSADCERLVDTALTQLGGLDVLFNNAAMAYFGWMGELSEEDFRKTMNEEVTLVFLLCRAAWPHLTEGQGCSIINMASAAGHQPCAVVPGVAHSAAKGAIHSMTRDLAMEGAKHRVRCNSISPGPVVSNQTEAYLRDPEFWAVMGQKVMLGRPGEPNDIAGCAVFLASDESSWITGTDIRVDGGMTAW